MRRKDLGTEPFVVCHWDTFDNEVLKLDGGGHDTLESTIKWTEDRYGDRIRSDGADRVEIIDLKGNIVWRRNVG